MVKRNPSDLNKLKLLTQIIDHMYFKTTKQAFDQLFLGFMIFFVVPYLIHCFSTSQ